MIVNTLAHVISLAALSTFTVFLFGRPNSLVYVWPKWRALALKVGLTVAVLGHGLSALRYPFGTPSVPPR